MTKADKILRSISSNLPNGLSRTFPSLGQIDSKIADRFVNVFGVAEFSKSSLIAATLIQPFAEHRHQM
jgi:hypothetical protein